MENVRSETKETSEVAESSKDNIVAESSKDNIVAESSKDENIVHDLQEASASGLSTGETNIERGISECSKDLESSSSSTKTESSDDLYLPIKSPEDPFSIKNKRATYERMKGKDIAALLWEASRPQFDIVLPHEESSSSSSSLGISNLALAEAADSSIGVPWADPVPTAPLDEGHTKRKMSTDSSSDESSNFPLKKPCLSLEPEELPSTDLNRDVVTDVALKSTCSGTAEDAVVDVPKDSEGSSTSEQDSLKRTLDVTPDTEDTTNDKLDAKRKKKSD